LIKRERERERERELLDFLPHFNTLTAAFLVWSGFPSPVIHTITLSHRYVPTFQQAPGFTLFSALWKASGLGGNGGREDMGRLDSESDAIKKK
jgi:hypothetical protein